MHERRLTHRRVVSPSFIDMRLSTSSSFADFPASPPIPHRLTTPMRIRPPLPPLIIPVHGGRTRNRPSLDSHRASHCLPFQVDDNGLAIETLADSVSLPTRTRSTRVPSPPRPAPQHPLPTPPRNLERRPTTQQEYEQQRFRSLSTSGDDSTTTGGSSDQSHTTVTTQLTSHSGHHDNRDEFVGGGRLGAGTARGVLREMILPPPRSSSFVTGDHPSTSTPTIFHDRFATSLEDRRIFRAATLLRRGAANDPSLERSGWESSEEEGDVDEEVAIAEPQTKKKSTWLSRVRKGGNQSEEVEEVEVLRLPEASELLAGPRFSLGTVMRGVQTVREEVSSFVPLDDVGLTVRIQKLSAQPLDPDFQSPLALLRHDLDTLLHPLPPLVRKGATVRGFFHSSKSTPALHGPAPPSSELPPVTPRPRNCLRKANPSGASTKGGRTATSRTPPSSSKFNHVACPLIAPLPSFHPSLRQPLNGSRVVAPGGAMAELDIVVETFKEPRQSRRNIERSQQRRSTTARWLIDTGQLYLVDASSDDSWDRQPWPLGEPSR